MFLKGQGGKQRTDSSIFNIFWDRTKQFSPHPAIIYSVHRFRNTPHITVTHCPFILPIHRNQGSYWKSSGHSSLSSQQLIYKNHHKKYSRCSFFSKATANSFHMSVRCWQQKGNCSLSFRRWQAQGRVLPYLLRIYSINGAAFIHLVYRSPQRSISPSSWSEVSEKSQTPQDKTHLHLSLLFMWTLPTFCAMNLNMDGEQLIGRRKYWESVMDNKHKTNYLFNIWK